MIFIKKNKKDNRTFYLTFFAIFLTSLLLYLPSLTNYFFQDDWFILNWVRTGSFLSFFQFRQDIIYWRPLSIPVFFAAIYRFFGLNYIAFHAFAFAIFLGLLTVIYKLLKLLFKDEGISLVLTFLYAIWSINFISISWLAATQYVTAPFFMACSLYSYIRYTESKKNLYVFFVYLTFVAALMSHETAIILPVFFLIWSLIYRKKIALEIIIPTIIISAAMVVIRFIVFPLPANGAYEIEVSRAVFYNYIWYWLWAFNLPEGFKPLVDPRNASLAIGTLKQFWWISTSVIFLCLTYLFIFLKDFKKSINDYLFGFSWFTIFLLPVLFVPSHSYPVYLSFAGVGFLYMIGNSLRNNHKIYTFLFLVLWALSSVANFQFTRATHWVQKEQSVSKTYSELAQQIIAKPSPWSTFVLSPAQKFSQSQDYSAISSNLETIKLSLSGQNALQVIYGDSTIKSVYSLNPKDLQDLNEQFYSLKPN